MSNTEQEVGPASVVSYSINAFANKADLTFQRDALAGMMHAVHEEVATSSTSMEMLGDLKERVVRTDSWPALAWLLRHDGDAMTIVVFVNGWATIKTASNDYERARGLSAEIAERIRTYDHDDTVTPITFWCLDQHNRLPLPMRRKVETPTWDSLNGNYSERACDGVEKLLGLDDCPEERMILWHGPSGTGKTHALRALARAWSGWCDVAFISDPEEFIGGSGSYSPSYLFAVTNHRSGRPEAEHRSTLIVLEDAGELMTGDARAAAGQGLSRLLNLTDGLLGQGLKVMVLITTNESLSALHPAVVRPGRLLAEIEFGPLPVEQANDWIREHDSDAIVDAPTTLAELYAISGGRLAAVGA
jgi:hypothetical protein